MLLRLLLMMMMGPTQKNQFPVDGRFDAVRKRVNAIKHQKEKRDILYLPDNSRAIYF
jgi:hypothetical protein